MRAVAHYCYFTCSITSALRFYFILLFYFVLPNGLLDTIEILFQIC